MFDGVFDNVVIYDYGHSQLGVTYDVPVKFFFNNEEMATFHLYSFYADLESGIYNCSDVMAQAMQIPFGETFKGVNKTFFKGDCKWGNNIITDGSVTVEKSGDKYTFIVDVTDNKGEHHYGKFNGKIKKENWHTKSTLGLFNTVGISESLIQIEGYIVSFIQLDAGYLIKNDTETISVKLTVGLDIIKPENNNGITGVHHVYEHAGREYAIANGFDVCGNYCSYKDYPIKDNLPYGVQFMQLQSGTITITRVNEPYKYRVDVDVVAANGYKIKGSSGKYVEFEFGYDPEK